ncbi:WAS/WASL-interacting protein family member 2-like [Mastomys coucha]|uniref:WAS/WASL-interacting protein family member 2-like n=1 Tax=Mastomys coucha TaxID=35658 RepID=UPI0012628B9E|nr:WAS/WASL-interacting protein family member 2-like [Mastomys coucha]
MQQPRPPLLRSAARRRGDTAAAREGTAESPDLHSPPRRNPLLPAPAVTSPGAGRDRGSLRPPPSPGESSGVPPRPTALGCQAVTLADSPETPQTLPGLPGRPDPRDKLLATLSPLYQPRCLSESQWTSPRPLASGRICACAALTPNKAGAPPLSPYRRVRILPPSLRRPGDWSVNSSPGRGEGAGAGQTAGGAPPPLKGAAWLSLPLRPKADGCPPRGRATAFSFPFPTGIGGAGSARSAPSHRPCLHLADPAPPSRASETAASGPLGAAGRARPEGN